MTTWADPYESVDNNRKLFDTLMNYAQDPSTVENLEANDEGTASFKGVQY